MPLQTRFGVVAEPSENPYGILGAFAIVCYKRFAIVAFSPRAVRDFPYNLIYLTGFAEQKMFM